MVRVRRFRDSAPRPLSSAFQGPSIVTRLGGLGGRALRTANRQPDWAAAAARACVAVHSSLHQ
eukprot:10253596-Alexandrium_andersonii.AAC.2